MAWGVGASVSGLNGSKSASTVDSFPISGANVAVGDVLVLIYAGDNATSGNSTTSTISVTDDRGNTWVCPGGLTNGAPGVSSGADVQLAYTRVTNALTTGIHNITAIHPSVVAKAMTYMHFTAGGAVAVDSAATSSATGSSATLPTLVGTPSENREHLWIYGLAAERPNTDTFTPDPAYTAGGANVGTTGGNAVTNIYARMAYRIGTSGTAETFNGSISSSADSANILFCLTEGTAGPSPIAATLTATEAANTLSAGATVAFPARTASASVTEAANTLSGDATVAFPARVADANPTEAANSLTGAASALVTGTASAGETADTTTADATVRDTRTGNASATEVADTASGTASVLVGGAFTRTEAADTTTASAGVAVAAALTRAETADTLVATASSALTADGAFAETADSTTASARVAVTADAAQDERADTTTATAKLLVAATGDVSEQGDDLTALAGVLIAGVGSAAEAADDLSASATVQNPFVTADGALDEVADVLAAPASVAITADADLREAADDLLGGAHPTAPAVYDLAHQVFVRLVNDEVLAFLALSECVVQASEEELRALLEVDEARTMSQPDEFTFQL